MHLTQMILERCPEDFEAFLSHTKRAKYFETRLDNFNKFGRSDRQEFARQRDKHNRTALQHLNVIKSNLDMIEDANEQN